MFLLIYLFCRNYFEKFTMANTPISMEKLRQIIRLKQAGHSNRKVSQMLGLHRETVRRYVLDKKIY